MSNVHRWPLSQTANKAQGTCGVCFQVHQLHLKDNTLHLHGPRTSRCSGSNRPPLTPRNPSLGPVVFLGPSPSPAAIGQPSSSRRLSSTASRGSKLVVTPSRIELLALYLLPVHRTQRSACHSSSGHSSIPGSAVC